MAPRFVSEESDSSDADSGEGPSVRDSNRSNKRSQRACDRCRKSKSKCEPATSEGARCKGCLAAGAECTFSGPAFRRGPPKGYIKALEHRLHQMESMLAAIMSSDDARTKSVINDLRKDALAQTILDGVDTGPFGPSGRLKRSVDPTKDNFFASIVSEAPPKRSNERSRRQSRVTRESVTQHNPSALVRPTLEWQDRLSKSLAYSGQSLRDSFQHEVQASRKASDETRPEAPIASAEPPRQKRRMEVGSLTTNVQWDDSHETSDSDSDHLDDCLDAFGNLSIDENKEVRYHDNSCGLYFLASDKRWHSRNIGGVWNFPMAHLWPGVDPGHTLKAVTDLPPEDVQDRLLGLYFTHVNSVVPVIDKEDFMEQYQAARQSGFRLLDGKPAQGIQRERMQKLTKLLLFSMFAYAMHYDHTSTSHAIDRPFDRGADYAASARQLLDAVYQESRTSTCQALILLGVREFGVGSLEAGWLHIGMAVRMAYDLGLNRDSEGWQQDGRLLFNPWENTIRRRIWWACCLADKFSAQFLGRPMTIHESDSSTPLPEVPSNDANELWDPCRRGPPVPGHFVNYFRHTAKLTVIHGEVIDNIYPVIRASRTPRRAKMEEIHSRLTRWSIDLPEPLQYSSTSKKPCPPPHVLAMHCYYWAIMLLLHRPFIPQDTSNGPGPSSADDRNTVQWRAYDICQGAASHISAFAALYDREYNLQDGPPLLATNVQSAGIMHIIALRRRPGDPQALTGLQQCIDACTRMKDTWPSSHRVRDLLSGAKELLDDAMRNPQPARPRKRPAQDALEHDVTPVHGTVQEQAHVEAHDRAATPEMPLAMPVGISQLPQAHAHPHPYAHAEAHARPNAHSHPHPHLHGHALLAPPAFPLHDAGGGFDTDNLLADLLGPGIAGLTVDMGVLPSFDWWPAAPGAHEHEHEYGHEHGHGHVPPPSAPPSHQGPGPGVAAYPPLPSHAFTFGEQEFSPAFVRQMRDPVLHFPSPPPHIP